MADIKIPYVNRSYQQTKEYILTRLFGLRDENGQFIQGGGLVPEVTDHTENSLLVRIISVWSGLVEMLNYYIDNAAKESFLATCKRYRSAVLIARFYDYRVKCRTAATCDVTFYLSQTANTDIIIPVDTILSTEDGVEFRTLQSLTIIAGQTRGSVRCKQSVKTPFLDYAVSNGKANQVYELPINVAYNSVNVTVGGISYTSKDTFAFSNSTDRHFIETVNETGYPVIKFGDGYFGVIPANGSTIRVSFDKTVGTLGNVSPYLINTIVTPVTLPTGVTMKIANLNGSTGGSSIEGLRELKRRVPLSNKTRMSAVTKQDYIDLSETHPSVEKAGVKTQCGAAIQLFIVPSGGGVASTQLLIDVAAYVESKKIIGRKLEVLPTGQVSIQLSIQLRTRAEYDRQTVIEAVKARLTEYGSYQNQTIGGTVEMNDIVAEIENTEGVIVSKIIKMTSVPFARPLGIWQTLDWAVVTQNDSRATVRWKISFISLTRFQLSKNGSYVGSYNILNEVVRNEVKFTVNAEYAVGSEFEFYTYPSFGTVQLNEMSLPVILTGDITINEY